MKPSNTMQIAAKKGVLTREINFLETELKSIERIILSGGFYYQGDPIYPQQYQFKKELHILKQEREALNNLKS